MKTLAQNNVGLNIKSDKLEYNIPAGALDSSILSGFGDDVTVEFNSKIVDPQGAFAGMEVPEGLTSKGKVIELDRKSVV